MPELPEVESVRRELLGLIIGRKIVSVKVFDTVIIRQGKLKDLIGRTVESISRIGKYLRFDTDSSIKMYSHFGMSGIMLWKDHIAIEPKHVRCSITFENGTLLYDDIRKLKGLWIDHDGNLPWKKLGIDALDLMFTPETLSGLLNKRTRSIKLTLLDQALIAGIGNIYASEILFRAKVNPLREAGSLGDDEVEALHESIISVLNAAIDASGTTLKDYKLSDGKEGNFQNFLKVYGKKKGTCPRCGDQIMRIVQAQRSTYFCQNDACQK